jgi:hypothetical protein
VLTIIIGALLLAAALGCPAAPAVRRPDCPAAAGPGMIDRVGP